MGRKQQKKRHALTERWYYDACTLKAGIIYDEIINNTRSTRKLTASFLSLGEAYGNCFRDGKAEDAPEKFFQLIEALKKAGKLDLISNAGIEKEFKFIRENCGILEVSDATHLATAIKNGCNIFRTFDSHFDLTNTQIEVIKKRFGLRYGFCIQKRNSPIK